MVHDFSQAHPNPGIKPRLIPMRVKDTMPVEMLPISIAKTTFSFIPVVQ
jgi:hypothetical protein